MESESPKITEQIAKLEAKLRSLESDAKLSNKRCEDQASAVERLRGLVPKHIADAVRVRTGLLSESLGIELQGCKGRVRELESCLDPERHRDEAAHISLLKTSFPEAVDERNSRGLCRYVLSPAWPAIKAAMETELAELRVKVAELQPVYDSELASIETALNYYSGGSQTE